MSDQVSVGASAVQHLLYTGAVCSDGFLSRNRATACTLQTPSEICPHQSRGFPDLLAGNDMSHFVEVDA